MTAGAPFPARLWLATIPLAVAFFWPTLTTSVPVWNDEAMIVEFGRVATSAQTAGTSWNLRSDFSRPMFTLAPLGTSLQEAAYRVTAPSNLGPHLSALLGQIAAAALFTLFLTKRGVSKELSYLLGLAFLLDPLCAISWRGARIDSWAFAALFGALIAIRADRPVRAFWAGVSIAVGVFLWTSFALLVPLIAWELLSSGSRRVRRGAALCAAGALAAACALVWPWWRGMANAWSDAQLLAGLTAFSAGGAAAQWRGLAESIANAPILAPLGCYAVVRGRRWGLAVAASIALAAVAGSYVYRLRLLYLVPYLYVASALWIGGDIARSRFAKVGLTLLIASGLSFTAVGTSLSGLADREGKDPLTLLRAVRDQVGDRPLRTYAADPDLYYVGRALHWDQLHCFDGCGVPPRDFGALFRQVDLAVFRTPPDARTEALIESAGLRFAATVLPGGGRRSSWRGWRFGPPTYGPYRLYLRPGAESERGERFPAR